MGMLGGTRFSWSLTLGVMVTTCCFAGFWIYLARNPFGLDVYAGPPWTYCYTDPFAPWFQTVIAGLGGLVVGLGAASATWIVLGNRCGRKQGATRN